jgi:pyrophosphatase PpaX
MQDNERQECPLPATRLERSRMIRGVLLDLDGTLIATKRLYLECYRRALHEVLGRLLPDDELIALHKGPTSELGLLRKTIPPERLEAGLERFYAEYDGLHDTHFEGVYDGVPALLDALREAGHTVAIITGKSRRAWEITRARYGLGDFAHYTFDDDVATPKPDPEGILRALDALGLEASEACYVGDSRGDILAASAAGVLPIAALWSKNPAERAVFATFAESHGGVSADSPADVLTIVG